MYTPISFDRLKLYKYFKYSVLIYQVRSKIIFTCIPVYILNDMTLRNITVSLLLCCKISSRLTLNRRM